MGGFFRSKKFRIILCIIALLIGMMLYAVTQDGFTLPTTGFIGKICNPIRSVSNRISDSVENTLDAFTRSKEYQQENEELRQRVAELEYQLVDYHKTQQELTDLEGFMGVKEDHEDFVLSDPCAIIGYVENDPFHAFYIDKGSEDGLSVYDPVVTAEGLVGIISEISETYATVETICSPNLSIGAEVSGKSESGIVEGDVTLSSSYRCRMIYLEKDTTLKKGDLVITSNSVGIFPQGYLIGSVESIEPMESGLSYCAVIRPSVDLENLSNVIVITDFAGKEQQNAAD
ncbi:rod shape-determining protein MreC [uncultured Ruminococcus sp.]|uniref:rod shape-determining protein MreC n=1 Tax=uncultured Ruminococcus sp. TaxID=165186 RepID=UPI0026355941|nr:rod shape-determining protein MreC [uncultured Ruminococcus sp.]